MKIDFTFINFFNSFLSLLIFYNFLIPKLLLLFLFIYILNYQIKSLFYNKYIKLGLTEPMKLFYIYKIKNIYFIWIWIFIYFFVFILLFFSFRIYRIGYVLDLNPIKKTYYSLYSSGEYLLILLFTLIIIIFALIILLLLKNIKTFLETYLLQIHLYLINYRKKKTYKKYPDIIYNPEFIMKVPYTKKERVKQRKIYKKNGLYKKIFYYFYFFSYSNVIALIMYIENNYLDIVLKNKYFKYSRIFNFSNHFRIILNTKYNIIIPINIFLYELIFCNLTITYLFYFLPFYFLYTLWYKLSIFWYVHRTPKLDIIIYELYYDYPTIIYLNLDQKEFNILFRYILGGLNQKKIFDNNDWWDSSNIMHYKRFILHDDNIYYNIRTHESISKEDYQNNNYEQKQEEEKSDNQE